jgi:ABC-type multidrug transport system fused ATPase/permease subunit
LKRVELWTLIESRGGLAAEADQTPLSHGERQLFGLACALLRRQKGRNSAGTGGILVLDEVSASVDAETELRISRIVREQFAGWTGLSVAHRLSTIRESDLVIVMDSGRAIEFGKPADLEGIEGSFWGEMVGKKGKAFVVGENAARGKLEDRIEVVRG